MRPPQLFQSDAFWAFLDQTGVSACNFLLTLLVARLVTVSDFSAYGLSVTVTLFISALHRAWLTQPMSILGVTESPAMLARRFHAVLRIQLAVWPAGLLVVFLIGNRYFPDLLFSAAVFVFLAAFLLQETVRRLLFTTRRLREATLLDVIAYAGQLAVVALLGLEGRVNASQTLFLGGAAFLLSFAWGVWQLPNELKKTNGLSGGLVRNLASEHWGCARWIFWSQIFLFGSFMLVPFLIAEFGQSVWVAQYNAAISIINVLNILRQTIGNYLPIVAARVLHQSGLARMVRMLDRVALAILIGASVTVLGLILWGDWLMALLYGVRYEAAADVLPQAAIGPLVGMLTFVSQAGGMALKRTEQIFYAYVAGTLCSLTCAPIFISHYGLEGGVWVANIGIIVPTVWHWISYKRDCRVMRQAEQS